MTPVLPHPPLYESDILITGGTGSFGRAFARYALDSGAARVAIFSRDEVKQSEMAAEFRDDRLRFMLGSVTDLERVRRAMCDVRLVIHAAALKQIPSCERNPWECVHTNVTGTQIVAQAAIEAGVAKAVFLSTDKASAPNTHYGACKLAAERLWTQANVYAAGTPTRFVATRYGNVLNSRGSVIPIWRAQRANKLPLSITDPACTRFWMTLSQAVMLVEQAATEGRGGEVFIPKIGACTILALADALGTGKFQVRETGLRRGEKLHETLISVDEARTAWDCITHYRLEPERTWEDLPIQPIDGAEPITVPFWRYSSDTTSHTLTLAELRDMLV